MSLWTGIRDAVEAVASVVGNYMYPGSGLITSQLVSKGAQKEPGYNIAMMGSGIAGGMSGNMANYGATMNTLSGSEGGMGSAPSWYTSGAADASGFGGGQDGIDAAQRMIQNGASPAEAIQIANITPQMAEQAGLTAGAGNTWQDIATQAGIPYSSGGGQPGQPGSGMPGEAGAQSQLDAMTASRGSANVGSETGMMGTIKGLMGGTGVMPWGSGGNLMQMGQGLYGLYESQKLKQMASGLSQQADPFGAYRQQYAQQMSMLSANPSSITQQPGYQAGLDAVQRSGAAQGYTGSGNMMAGLSKYGQDFYNNTMGMYGQFAGANANPAAAAQLQLQGQGLGANLTMNSLGMLGKGTTMAGS